MSEIDFSEGENNSRVATKAGRTGRAMRIGALGAAAVTLMAYLNWPESSPQDESPATDEVFMTSNSDGPRTFDPAPSNTANAGLIQIPVAGDAPPPQAANVDAVVEEGVDLEKQRAELEARMRAEEEALRLAEQQRLAEEEAKAREEEAKRVAEEEARKWQRLRSGLIIVDGRGDGENHGEAGVAVAADGQLVQVPGADSDSNKAFLAASEQSRATTVRAARFDRIDALIPQGTMIRGFLQTAVNTDLPGMLRAVVQEDVYSLDGQRVLIPKGSFLVGEYRSGLARGQKRVFVVWNRIIRSDGMSVEIASPGADRLGRAGITGKVDTHFIERFGAGVMLSVIGGAAEFVAAVGGGDTGRTVTTTDPVTGEARSIATDRVSDGLQEIANEAFRDSSKIPPTIYVAQGSQITVYTRRDLDFSGFYADPVQQELARLKKGIRRAAPIDPTPLFMTPKDNVLPTSFADKRSEFPPAPR